MASVDELIVSVKDMRDGAEGVRQHLQIINAS